MKKIGIVGGVGWRSTVEYYSGICGAFESSEASGADPAFPEMSIESLDLGTAVSLFGNADEAGSWAGFDDYHREALLRLVARGAEVALIASNTPHERFEAITGGIDIPVVDIFEALAVAAQGAGARAVLILGTRVTMGSRRLGRSFERQGLTAVAPPQEALRMTLELIADLQAGTRTDGPARLAAIVEAARGTVEFDAICLACTELPLALGDLAGPPIVTLDGLRYIDSVRVHIQALMELAG
jgi:aspartate racemase